MAGYDLTRRRFFQSTAAVATGAWLGRLPAVARSASADEDGVRRYLYMSSPDAAQRSHGDGIYVFDIDDGHRFVKFVEVPQFKGGLRGFCSSLPNRAAYYTKTDGTLGAFDLEEETVRWEKNYTRGGDRACIRHDGSTLYVPDGWWHRSADGGFSVIDADTGKVLDRRTTGAAPHNSVVTPDGEAMLIGGAEWLDVYRVDDLAPVWRFSGVGDGGVFPFTVDSRRRYAYVCHHDHVGFDVVDLEEGRKLHAVRAGDGIARRTHGVGLTPDEREIWISDQYGERLVVFDNTALPDEPPLKGEIPLSRGGHGWVGFSLAGDYGWCHTPDVIDVKTKEIVAKLRDGEGNPVDGSKFFEAHFRGDEFVRVGKQFGMGRAHVDSDEP